MRLRLPRRAAAPKTVLATSPDPKGACMSPDAARTRPILPPTFCLGSLDCLSIGAKARQQSRYGTICDQLQPSAHPWTHAHEDLELKTACLQQRSRASCWRRRRSRAAAGRLYGFSMGVERRPHAARRRRGRRRAILEAPRSRSCRLGASASRRPRCRRGRGLMPARRLRIYTSTK